MPVKKKRRKKSGIVYFATNNRINNMVKIGQTIDSAVKRLEAANKSNPFMCGRWSISIKVKTNNVERTEELAHKLFEEYRDAESISKEMFFIPEGMTVKKMADLVRKKDDDYKKLREEKAKIQSQLEEQKRKLKEMEEASKKDLFNITNK